MNDPIRKSDRSQSDVPRPGSSSGNWRSKFAVAFSGLVWALRSQSSFSVHLPVAIAVLMMAVWLRVSPMEFALLVLTIGLVLALEIINTAIETLVAVLHPAHDPLVGKALDVAAAAVLVASLAAIVVGLLVLGPPLWSVAATRVAP